MRISGLRKLALPPGRVHAMRPDGFFSGSEKRKKRSRERKRFFLKETEIFFFPAPQATRSTMSPMGFGRFGARR